MIAPRQILFQDLSDAGKNVLRQLLAALLRQMDQVNEVFMRTVQMRVGNRISGGKVLSSHTRRVINRASDALRMAAVTLERSQSALGGFYRRMKGRLGAAEAITAAAHKLARIIYRLIKHGEACVRQGMEDYERKFQERKLHALRKTAISMGFNLIAKQAVASPVS